MNIIKITNGSDIIEVSEKAFRVIYEKAGFKEYVDKVDKKIKEKGDNNGKL